MARASLPGTVLVGLVGVALLAGGVSVVVDDIPVTSTESTTRAPGSLVPEGHTLETNGTDVTGTTVFINNTGTSLDGTVRAEVVAANGTVLASGTEQPVLASGRNEVTVTFDRSVPQSEVALVNTTIDDGTL